MSLEPESGRTNDAAPTTVITVKPICLSNDFWILEEDTKL